MGTITACNYITCPFNDAGNCSRTAPCIYTNRPIKTNADHIHNMTDEELADWLCKHGVHTSYYGYDTKDAILEWLKSPLKIK